MKNLKAVILAGGMGTRLMEETRIIPKPLVKIGKVPIILHIMRHYNYFGIKKFVVCLGYKGDLIIDYFKKNKQKNFSIEFIKTGLKSLTGKRLKKVQNYVTDPFFLTYGDGVSNINILHTFKEFKKIKKIALVLAINPEERYGILKINKNSLVTNFSEKPKKTDIWINGGFFIFSKKIFQYLNDKNTILERKPLINLSKNSQLAAYKHFGFWKSMDNLRDKVELNKIYKNKKFLFKTMIK
jgi:glucose-1-phosphate cytidylyltransferase